MPARTAVRCSICTNPTSTPHLHHVLLQAHGGERGPQVPLCGDCHTRLHNHVTGLVSAIRRGKTLKKRYWNSLAEESRALPLVEIAVQAALNPMTGGKHPIMLKLDTAEYNRLKVLKVDLGLSSIEKTLLYCIQNTLQRRGLLQ